ncbi:hypothetical protein [Ornithinimicrobium kibberense]|uniref:hypothetical protein n=1 Tax=Ornithinimicrobium kibberense TaxID=282060 RepID=UPI0036176FD4
MAAPPRGVDAEAASSPRGPLAPRAGGDGDRRPQRRDGARGPHGAGGHPARRRGPARRRRRRPSTGWWGRTPTRRWSGRRGT